MRSQVSPSSVRAYAPALAFVALALIFWRLIEFYFGTLKVGFDELDALNTFQDKALGIIIEMNKLIISLSLLVIGAIGGILLQKHESIRLQSVPQKVLAILAMLFAITSVYLGYTLYFYLVDSLMQSGFDTNNPLIEQSMRLQFYSFLASLLLIGVFVINQTLRAEQAPREDKPLKVIIENAPAPPKEEG